MKHKAKGPGRSENWKMRFTCWMAVLAAVLCMGCGKAADTDVAQYPVPVPPEPSVEESHSIEISWLVEGPSSAEESPSAGEPSVVEESTPAEISIAEDGSYTSKEDVALYLETYDKLPGNFITKKEAQALGWEGGSLEPYAPGKCIGGDKFGNYEGLLPKEDGRTYKECDIDTLGAKSRGAKRIVYSNDGLIYYTEDHYATFELLYD